MNPLVVVHMETRDGVPIGRSLWVWCPGCEAAHTPRAANKDGSRPDSGPYWDWNGRTDERFTISPSLLCYDSAHLCPPGYQHDEVCPDPVGCGNTGHLILNADMDHTPPEGDRVLGHKRPHVADPAFGPCHSFIRDGRWQYLSDTAHRLAGQTVPMVPVPDWLVRL